MVVPAPDQHVKDVPEAMLRALIARDCFDQDALKLLRDAVPALKSNPIAAVPAAAVEAPAAAQAKAKGKGTAKAGGGGGGGASSSKPKAAAASQADPNTAEGSRKRTGGAAVTCDSFTF